MGRPRIGRVSQHLQTIRRLEQVHRGTPRARAMTFLRLLKERPDHSMLEIAVAIGVSKPTVNRWWRIYREAGIEALLKLRRRGETMRQLLEPTAQQRLHDWLSRTPGRSVADVREWLRETLAIAVSQPMARTLRRRHGSDASAGGPEHARSPNAEGHRVGILRGEVPILRLINALPDTCDVIQGNAALREALSALLPEVDHIVINVDTSSDLLDADGYRPDMFQLQEAGTVRSTARGTVIARRRARQPVGADVLEGMRTMGLPIELYQSPHFVDYFYQGRAYIGTVFLFRLVDAEPMPNSTIEMLDALEPFVRYALSDLVVRHHYLHPREHSFYQQMQEMANQLSLTHQERRILAYRIRGYSCRELAEQFGITEDGVKRHLTAIYRKSGTSGYVELFSKYFTPQIDTDL